MASREGKYDKNKYDRLIHRVAANIKRVRKKKRLTQMDMIEKGFDLRNFQRLESGSHSPSVYGLFRLAEAFRVDISEFFK